MATYTPHADYDPNPVGPYTLDDVRDLARHHGAGEVRELSDGRVVLASWNPASGDEPKVVAYRSGEGRITTLRFAFDVEATDRTRKTEFGTDEAPCYRRSAPAPSSRAPRFHHETARLPDGTFAYIYYDTLGMTGLYRTAQRVDAGGNVYEERTAPTSLFGINPSRRRGGVATTVSYTDLVGWLDD